MPECRRNRRRRAAQTVQLRAQAPHTGDRVVHRVANAEATLRRYGEGEILIGDVHLLIADRDQPRQHGFGVELEVQPRTVFQMDFARGFRFEVAGQINADADVRGQQGGQVAILLHLLQLQQAGVDFLGGIGRMAQAGEDIAQYRRGDFLRTAVGVDPVDGKAGAACEYFQLRIAHRRSPSRGCKGVAAVRLTSAQYGARMPGSDRSSACGC